MSFSCILYPAVGSSCTQLLGSIVPIRWVAPIPIRWVRSYFFAGYNSTHSLGTKQSTNNRTDYSNVGSTLYPLVRPLLFTVTPPLPKYRMYAMRPFHGLALDDQ